MVTRLGGFHIAEKFLKSIGFFMKDGGIEDLLTESGVCKSGTANSNCRERLLQDGQMSYLSQWGNGWSPLGRF